MLRHADCGKSVDAHSKAHLNIGPRGTADGVHQFILVRNFAGLVSEHEETILVPGDFMNLHPESVDMDRVRWLFILFPRRPHRKIAAGDWRHAIGNQRIGDSDFVSLHLTSQWMALNTIMDMPHDFMFLSGARSCG